MAWLVLCLLGGLESLMIYLFKPEVIQSSKAYWLPVMRVVNGMAAISLMLYPGHLFLKSKGWTFKIVGYALLMLLFILVYLAVSVVQFQWAFLYINLDLFLAAIGETIMTDLHHIASYYFFLLFICIGKDYFEERTQVLLKKEQLESELSRTQLKVLQRQIQPHFLFNTLNNVVAITDERKEAAKEMLVDLSTVLRLSMEMDFGKKITLTKELDILALYLAIEKRRFEHQLSFSFTIDKGCEDTPVLPFLLQPLAENAIKHGFRGGVEKLHLNIAAKTQQDYLEIKVSNTGAPIQEPSYGIGWVNIEERLKNAYDSRFTFTLEQVGNQVVNTLKFPRT